ncbi:hypothetical protein D3C74_140270 [compost metagenome]
MSCGKDYLSYCAGSETDINPPDIPKFFTEWKKILHYMIIEVANPLGVYVLNTSSNLVRLEQYTDEWFDVFSTVKQLFNGYVFEGLKTILEPYPLVANG